MHGTRFLDMVVYKLVSTDHLELVAGISPSQGGKNGSRIMPAICRHTSGRPNNTTQENNRLGHIATQTPKDKVILLAAALPCPR